MKPEDRLLRAAPTLIRDARVFDVSWVPEKLLHRDAELNALAQALRPAIDGQQPRNVVCLGKSGTGKSAAARHILQGVLSLAQKKGHDVRVAQADCKRADTPTRLFQALAGQAEGKGVEYRIRSGVGDTEHFDRIRAALPKDGILILLLDDLDQLNTRNQGNDRVLRLILRFNEQDGAQDHGQVSIVATINNLFAFDGLDPATKSSFARREQVVFHPYDSRQLEDILHHRAEAGLVPGALAEGTLPLIAALSAQEHGDARRAIELLSAATQEAARVDHRVVSEADVRTAHAAVENTYIRSTVMGLPLHHKVILLALVKAHAAATAKNPVTSRVGHECYARLSPHAGSIEPVGHRRFLDYLHELEGLGLVVNRDVSKGRYGKRLEPDLGCDARLILDGLKEDPLLRDLVLPPTKQQTLGNNGGAGP